MKLWGEWMFLVMTSASSRFRNSSTKDLSQFAAEAIAFNRQLSLHDEQQEDAEAIVCSMRLSPPSNSRLARRRAKSSALRSTDFAPACDDLEMPAWIPLWSFPDWFPPLTSLFIWFFYLNGLLFSIYSQRLLIVLIMDLIRLSFKQGRLAFCFKTYWALQIYLWLMRQNAKPIFIKAIYSKVHIITKAAFQRCRTAVQLFLSWCNIILF